MMKTLVLITDVFPYGSITETAFVAPEIPHLARRFDRVVIAPRMRLSDTPDITDLPANVEVTDALIIRKTLPNKLRSLPHLGRAILHDLRHTDAPFRDILAYSAYVDICRRDLQRFIPSEKLDLSSTLFYTFWFDFTTAALSLIPGTRFLTRTHRQDLYEDQRFISPYWRMQTLERIISCHPVAHDGMDYLRRRYPDYASKIDMRLLGTRNTTGLNPLPANNQTTLLSIARMAPEKAVIRQLEMVMEVARRHPDNRMRYVHVGDGPLMAEFRRMAHDAPANLTVDIRGALHNDEVHAIFSTLPIDAVLLLSHSEGLPVSLCEAISYGIPYLATDVGGIREILPVGTLPLLPDDFRYDDFEKGLMTVIGDKTLRKTVRGYWEQRFDAERLRSGFADELAGLL